MYIISINILSVVILFRKINEGMKERKRNMRYGLSVWCRYVIRSVKKMKYIKEN